MSRQRAASSLKLWESMLQTLDLCGALIDNAKTEKEDRIKLVSFTGSAKVGWELKAHSGRKRVLLGLWDGELKFKLPNALPHRHWTRQSVNISA